MAEDLGTKVKNEHSLDKSGDRLDRIMNMKFEHVLPFVLSAFVVYGAFHRHLARRAEEFGLTSGQKQGIEIMDTIYNTQGSNEPLRYSQS